MPDWLKMYFGESLSVVKPSIVFEGSRHAVVMLQKPTRGANSSVGYILVNKSGRHNSSLHASLHEGLARADDLKKMKKELDEAERGGV